MSLAKPEDKKMIKLRTRKLNSAKKKPFLKRALSPNDILKPKISVRKADPKSQINRKSPLSKLKYSDNLLEPGKESPVHFKSSPNINPFSKIYSKIQDNCQVTNPANSDKIKLSSKQFIRGSVLGRKSNFNIMKKTKTFDPDEFLQQVCPLNPEEALDYFAKYLNQFEQSEIQNYEQIYYIGMKSQKISSDSNGINSGFDDEYYNYKYIIGDHIAYQYEIQEFLGKGVCGIVCKCLDHKTKTQIAIKLIKNEKQFYKQANIEISVLEHIKKLDTNDSSQCIHLKTHFLFRKHICLTFDLLSTNLYTLLKSSNFRGFSLSVVRRIIAQMVSALIFLKKSKIIHCDLKPENVLLKEFNKTAVKIIDFSSACFEKEGNFTYIQSRYYRAPEVILGLGFISAIDIWSLGCIAAEICAGVPLFAGENETDQLWCIMEYKGVPPKSLVEKASRKKEFFDTENLRFFENSKGVKRVPGSRTFKEKLRTDDFYFLDFVEKCLEWNPYERMTPEEAFYHEFIQEELRNYG